MSVDAAHEHGMLALIDDAKRAAALAEVREGRMYDLGRILDEQVPVFPGRYFKQTLVTTAHHANPDGGVGANDVNWITELVSGTMQLGTHLDALSHLQMGEKGYGGFSVSELAGTAGVRRLGVETVPQIVTRGWLVDVAQLHAGDVITPHAVPGSILSRATPCCSTPAGAAIGMSPTAICPASRARAASLRRGSPSDRSH